ncbi:MAG: DUF4142 domain-containing protein [Chitinophagaceae bacterium]
MIVILFSCSKKNNDPNTLNNDDRLFISSLIQSHKQEIRESKQALNKSQHPAVRKFASEIIYQYTADQAYVMEVVSKVGYDMNDTTSITLQSDLDSRNLTGFDYDTAYMKSRVRSHRVLMEQYRNEINNGNHTYVRYNLVNQGLERVRNNWLMADSIARSF